MRSVSIAEAYRLPLFREIIFILITWESHNYTVVTRCKFCKCSLTWCVQLPLSFRGIILCSFCENNIIQIVEAKPQLLTMLLVTSGNSDILHLELFLNVVFMTNFRSSDPLITLPVPTFVCVSCKVQIWLTLGKSGSVRSATRIPYRPSRLLERMQRRNTIGLRRKAYALHFLTAVDSVHNYTALKHSSIVI
jgi:hypothetical protein